MKKMLKIAEQIARESHKDQKRWDGLDYITHPEAVADMLKEDRHKIIAWLHDVLEDTQTSEQDLYDKGISQEIVKSILYLSRKENENYKDFILRCSQDHDATIVKIADLTHNLSNLKRGSMRDKYLLAKYLLESVMIDKKEMEE